MAGLPGFLDREREAWKRLLKSRTSDDLWRVVLKSLGSCWSSEADLRWRTRENQNTNPHQNHPR
jgi:RNase P/RNase MRP subunit POP5